MGDYYYCVRCGHGRTWTEADLATVRAAIAAGTERTGFCTATEGCDHPKEPGSSWCAKHLREQHRAAAPAPEAAATAKGYEPDPCPFCREHKVVRMGTAGEEGGEEVMTQPNEMTDEQRALRDALFEKIERASPVDLSFRDLRRANVERCESAYHAIVEWSPTDWACAMAGECGEACNLVKKLRRLDGAKTVAMQADAETLKAQIADEIADMVIYADLLAKRLDIDLGRAVTQKFNATSDKVRSPVRLSEFPWDRARQSGNERAEGR